MENKTIPISPHGLLYTYTSHIAPPGADSFALASFAANAIGEKRGRACDLGAGGGLLSLLLAERCPGICVDGVEADTQAAVIFTQNAARLGEERVRLVYGDINGITGLLTRGAYDYAVSNPPYFKGGSGAVSEKRPAARSGLSLDIEGVCSAAGYLLKNGGRFFASFRPERLLALADAARGAGLEPKILRFVCHSSAHSPFLMLLECVKGARPGLKVIKSLRLFKQNGKPTAESDRIYNR